MGGVARIGRWPVVLKIGSVQLSRWPILLPVGIADFNSWLPIAVAVIVAILLFYVLTGCCDELLSGGPTP